MSSKIDPYQNTEFLHGENMLKNHLGIESLKYEINY